jgi:hypothetical protein
MTGNRRIFINSGFAVTATIVMAGRGTPAMAAPTAGAPTRRTPLAAVPIPGPAAWSGTLVRGNGASLLAGYWESSPHEVTGFLWKGGALRWLPGSSRPTGMNEQGTVVGNIVSHSPRKHSGGPTAPTSRSDFSVVRMISAGG